MYSIHTFSARVFVFALLRVFVCVLVLPYVHVLVFALNDVAKGDMGANALPLFAKILLEILLKSVIKQFGGEE